MPINPPYTYGMPGQQMPNYQVPQGAAVMQQPFQMQQTPTAFTTQPGLSIVSITSDDQVQVHPVASGNTVLFVNFNTNRMCFKSTNANGVPMALRWATFVYDETEQQGFHGQNQNDQNSVSRQEFDELKAMLAAALQQQPQQQIIYQDDQNKRYNGKRGNRNDGPTNGSANNG